MSQTYWTNWARTLQRLKITGISLAILDGAGPFKLVLAQFILAGLPFFDRENKLQWQAAAEMLEDNKTSSAFASFLREEKIH